MVTRRTALGTGLALASAACAVGAGASVPSGDRRRKPAIDALLIDDSLEAPRRLAAFIKAGGRTMPVVAIRLEAATQAGLLRVLNDSQVVVGVSSGATLFCLERIAWDHGFRLTARSQWIGGAGEDGFLEDVTAYLSGAQRSVTTPSHLVRAYRPSRADGTLHAWVMRKSAGQQFGQRCREA